MVGISIVNLTAYCADKVEPQTLFSQSLISRFLSLKETYNCVLILSAHPFEQAAIIKRFGKRHNSYNPLRFIREVNFAPCFRGQLYHYRGHKLLFAATGENFPLTFINVQTVCQNLPMIKAVIFVGIVGGVNPSLIPGDICTPSQWACHTIGYVYNPLSKPKESKESSPESVSESAPREFVPSQYHERHPPALRTHYYAYYPDLLMSGIGESSKSISCSASLLAVAEKAKHTIEVAKFNEFVLNGAQQPANLHIGGTGVSGTVFVDNAEYREFLYRTYEAQIVDMESMAAAFVCQLYQKDFIAIRAVSDLAGENGEHGVSSIDRGGRKLAARNAAWFLKCFLNCLPR